VSGALLVLGAGLALVGCYDYKANHPYPTTVLSCTDCQSGIPIYDAWSSDRQVDAYGKDGEECEVTSNYTLSAMQTQQPNAAYVFVDWEPHLYLRCPSGHGFVYTSHTSFGRTPAPRAVPPEVLEMVSCSETDQMVGQSVTCVIRNAYCDYRPDVGGNPTFCNDAPYPNHNFTLLVWGGDWSDLDGSCVEVTGFVERYDGKPQIVAGSRSQVSPCQ